MNKARSKINDYQNEINAREEELANMKARLHQKAEELKIAQIGAVANQTRAQEYGSQIYSKDEEIKLLQSQVMDLKQQLIECHATRQSEGTALLEVEHMKADNDRLIKLLKTTKEYKGFAKFAEDNSGSVRYMNNTKRNKCSVRKCPANKPTENTDPNAEDENWIPQEAFDVAYNFKFEHGGQLTDVLINKLLKALNSVWRERERRQIARVKNNCNQQLQKLRRQITNTAPLSEVNAKTEINRLRRQLTETQKKLRQNVVKKKKSVGQTDIAEHVESAFKLAGDYQDERNKVMLENKALKVRLQDSEKLHGSEDFERAKFMQGAAWQANKSLNENRELLSKI